MFVHMGIYGYCISTVRAIAIAIVIAIAISIAIVIAIAIAIANSIAIAVPVPRLIIVCSGADKHRHILGNIDQSLTNTIIL